MTFKKIKIAKENEERLTPFAELRKSEKSWQEDYSHENGNYMNHCIFCKEEFIGHKRRCICKKCFLKKTKLTRYDQYLTLRKEFNIYNKPILLVILLLLILVITKCI